ncbi:MAG: hypothetical protein LUG15_03900, partial [Oscillospiraceae bacterium]|nr:hypothetical protein [Oscillospiraceae bacterium]
FYYRRRFGKLQAVFFLGGFLFSFQFFPIPFKKSGCSLYFVLQKILTTTFGVIYRKRLIFCRNSLFAPPPCRRAAEPG